MQPGGKASSSLDAVKVKIQNLSDQEKKIGAGIRYVMRPRRSASLPLDRNALQ